MPSSTRWYPAQEHLMILEEIYRRTLTTPKSTQIQYLASYLSFYGKIEDKNVLYWFQNRKARDRKKRKQQQQQQQQQQQLLLVHQTHDVHMHRSACVSCITTEVPHFSIFQESLQEAPAQVTSSSIRREDVPEKWIKLECSDWKTMDLTTVYPYQTRPALETLQLFPNK